MKKTCSIWLGLLATFIFFVNERCQVRCYQPPSAYSSTQDKKVRISEVQALTLYKGRLTTGRRNSPVSQLECVGGCAAWTPDVVQCYNMGSDGIDAQWRCETDMPTGIRFGITEVGCEGYDYPEDPYILAGSCQLMYELKGSGTTPTDTNRRTTQDSSYNHQQQHYQQPYSSNPKPTASKPGSGDSGTMALLLVGAVVILICLCSMGGSSRPRSTGAAPRGGGGGGYGGDGGGGFGGGHKPSTQSSGATGSSGMANFGTGAAVGGAAGYAAGRMHERARSNRTQAQQQQQTTRTPAAAPAGNQGGRASSPERSKQTGFATTRRR